MTGHRPASSASSSSSFKRQDPNFAKSDGNVLPNQEGFAGTGLALRTHFEKEKERGRMDGMCTLEIDVPTRLLLLIEFFVFARFPQ
jgi:hypothetical protein